MRRTKIVCTIGPASSSEETLRAMIRAGMDVARLNFSHGTHESHAALISAVRRAAGEEGKVVAILQDLQGPRIRVGEIADGSATLLAGATFVLTTSEVPGSAESATVHGAPLPQDVKVGDHILLDDGAIELQVVETRPTEVVCRVVVGGTLKPHKGLNGPGRTLSVPSITDKDVEDVVFGIEQRVDYVALSFVRSADDVNRLREIMAQHGAAIPIMSKIEKHEAVAAFDEILEASNAIMVARGDLGIEVPAEQVPLLQKMIVAKSRAAGKPVVTATQMLDSMIRNPRPTRAEVNDVANAILDGTDATMLSGETAAGLYPVEAVATMARIAETTDAALPYASLVRETSATPPRNTADAIGQAACEMSFELGARAIVAFTESGYTARTVAKHRPPCRLVAATPSETTLRRLALIWGVEPFLAPESESTEDMLRNVVGLAVKAGRASQGDLLVITAGLPLPASGRTNLLKLHTVGDPL
ncbi:MAG TPA: pyruvate kinase [Chloroflexota bacterium]